MAATPSAFTSGARHCVRKRLPRPAKLSLAIGLCVTLHLALPSEAAAQRAMLVGVETITKRPMTRTVTVIGRLVARRAGDIATEISGRLEAFPVEVGARVKKGDVIARLNTETLMAELRLAESALAEAKAELETAKAEAELAELRLRRQARLKGSAAFSKARFEDARIEIAVARSKVARAEARVATRAAAVARRRLDIAKATVSAPYSGMVVQRYAEIGGYVRSGDRLVRLIGTGALEIEADVPAQYLSGLKPGHVVRFWFGAHGDGPPRKAAVRAILASENPLTRTRAVRFALEPGATDEGGAASPAEGQSVTVEIPAGPPRLAVAVPKDAILKRAGRDLVFVIEDKKAKARVVALGQSVAGYVEVLSGLKLGDVVVVRGNERLRPDTPVRIDKSET